MDNKSLLSFAALSCIAATAQAQQKAAAATQRPNIVYIMCDDHAFQCISAYGGPISKLAPTPNIDRIANEGVRFTNSFVANSISGPRTDSASSVRASTPHAPSSPNSSNRLVIRLPWWASGTWDATRRVSTIITSTTTRDSITIRSIVELTRTASTLWRKAIPQTSLPTMHSAS